MTFRFGVGSADGMQSSIWKLWVQGDEAYLLQRSMAKHVKFSFHKTGNCRWAEINPNKNGEERKILEWDRGSIPPNANESCKLLALAFPTNHLSNPREHESKNVSWVNPAPNGQATAIEIMLCYHAAAEIKGFFAQNDRQLIYTKRLRSGIFLHAVRSYFACGPVNLTSPNTSRRHGQVFGNLKFPDHDLSHSGRPVRMIIFGGNEMPPCIWELGGYEKN